MKHTKPYFSHDEGARKDPKLLNVMMKLGHEGKSVFWDVVEMLYEQGGYLELAQFPTYAFDLRTSEKVLKSLVSDFGLFKKDRQKFWSQAVLDRMDLRNEKSKRRADAGAKGGKAKAANRGESVPNRSNATAMLQQTQSIAVANPSNELASKVKETTVNTSYDVAPELSSSSISAGTLVLDQAGNGGSRAQGDNIARTLALSATDPNEEILWDASPLTKPLYFKRICIENAFAAIDHEHYREQALAAAKRDGISRTIKQWQSWVVKYLNNQKKGGPMLKVDAAMPTEPTPKDQLPPRGKELPGQILAFECERDEQTMNTTRKYRQSVWPTAIIHFIHPR